MGKNITNDLKLFAEDLANTIRRKLGSTKEEMPLVLYSDDPNKDVASVIKNSYDKMGSFFNSVTCTTSEGINSIKTIIVHDSVQHITTGAYRNLRNLKSVNLPTNLLTIGEDAFNSCQNLDTINIPNSITRVYPRAFANTAWLKNYTGDVVYIGKACYAVNTSEEVDVIIPDNIISFTDNSFTKSNILSIVGYGEITFIGGNSFAECLNLKKVEFPNTSSSFSVEQYLFKACSALKEVKLGNITIIKHYAFEGCTSLENLYFLGDTVPELWSGALTNINPNVTIHVKPNLVDSWKSALRTYSLDDNVVEYNEL